MSNIHAVVNIAMQIEAARGRFFTFHERPAVAAEILREPLDDSENIAIVMQGPLIEKDNFTYETLKLYRHLFPKNAIVVSTWEGENPDLIAAIEALGVAVLANQKPEHPGVANVNYQIHSTCTGLQWAAERGLPFCLKTRTDFRIYSHAAMRLFIDMLEAFPLAPNTPGQAARIVFLSENTSKYRVYSASDITVFGTTIDMIRYWNAEAEEPRSADCGSMAIGDWSKGRYAEVRFFTSFMERVGIVPDFTLAQYWEFLGKRCVVIDNSTIDTYWRKYIHFVEWRYRNYGLEKTSDPVTFADWMSLYVNRRPPAVDESVQRLPWRVEIKAE